MNPSSHYPVVQIAYFVSDIEQAAQKMAATFGAGPFYLIRQIELAWAEHRGQPCDYVHSSAYGQWGDVMMELVQQDSDGPSPFRDLYAPGAEGIHHVATMCSSLQQAAQDYAAQGIDMATRSMTTTGTEFWFLDATAKCGHFIEVYEKSPQLLEFYSFIEQAAVDWRGQDPVRHLSR